MSNENKSIFKEFNWNDSSIAFRWSLIIGMTLILIMIFLSVIGTERDNIGLIMSLVVLILINATPALYKFLYISSNFENNKNEDNIDVEEIVLKFLMSWFSVIFAIILLFTKIDNNTLLLIFTSFSSVVVGAFTAYIMWKYNEQFKQIRNAIFYTLFESLRLSFEIIKNVFNTVGMILKHTTEFVFNIISKIFNNNNKKK